MEFLDEAGSEKEALRQLKKLVENKDEPTFNDYRAFIRQEARYFGWSRQSNLLELCKKVLLIEAQIFELYRQAKQYGWNAQLHTLRTATGFARSLGNTVRNSKRLDELSPTFFENLMNDKA